MMNFDGDLIDWAVYAETRSALGANFVRILGYFREDGSKSIDQIESAMGAHDAAALVLPAHTLKGEASQFGAVQLAAAAETIEMTARNCVEHRETPEEVIELVAALRPMFEETLSLLELDTSPLVHRQVGGFDRKFG